MKCKNANLTATLTRFTAFCQLAPTSARRPNRADHLPVHCACTPHGRRPAVGTYPQVPPDGGVSPVPRASAPSHFMCIKGENAFDFKTLILAFSAKLGVEPTFFAYPTVDVMYIEIFEIFKIKFF